MRLVVLDNRLKLYLAKFGYNRVFGLEVDERKRMADSDLIARFDRVWDDVLRLAILNAERCDPEDARCKINADQQRWVRDDQEQREFWLKDGLFVAQLDLEFCKAVAGGVKIGEIGRFGARFAPAPSRRRSMRSCRASSNSPPSSKTPWINTATSSPTSEVDPIV